LSLDLSRGPRGTPILVMGRSVTPNGTIPIGGLTFGGIPWNTSLIPIDSVGTIVPTMLTIPSGAALGETTVTATDTGGLVASGIFTVTQPTLTLSPTEGYRGTLVTATGSGWVPGALGMVQIQMPNSAGILSTIAIATPDAGGNISATFNVPLYFAAGSVQSVRVIDSYGNASPIQSFQVSLTGVTVSPTSGTAGSQVTITGYGFLPYTGVMSATIGGVQVLPPIGILTGSDGSFQVAATVPALVPGLYPVVVTVGGMTATSSFTISSGIVVSGAVREVNCAPLGGVTIIVSKNSTEVARATSDSSGSYQLTVTEAGIYQAVAGKSGFRSETQQITVGTAPVTLDFTGDHSLLPNAPSMSYALGCVNQWLYPTGECGLNMEKALSVVDAWLNPVE
ncbi:MAG: carboxypeptidase regulatory-like domain-containing protein, partial [Dehalococcoidia bacterium]